jgi:hypothetical protein
MDNQSIDEELTSLMKRLFVADALSDIEYKSTYPGSNFNSVRIQL